jgi:hypothetical protein
VGERHDGAVIDLPLSPRARRAAWLSAWATLAIGGAVTALIAGVLAVRATVDAALSGQADATSAPIVAMSVGLLVLVGATAAFGWLVMRTPDPVDTDPVGAAGPRRSAPRLALRPGGLVPRQPLYASWVFASDDAP